MRRLGISIYPEKSSDDEIFEYIDNVSKIGCKRIFSCLLSVNQDKEKIKTRFKRINDYIHTKGMEIILDVSPKVFAKLDITYQDLIFFKEVGADGLRLDAGFSGNEESLMTFNPYGLKIEINMSNDVPMIDTIMKYQPNSYNLLGCHNFYPHDYSGLDLNHFISCSKRFKQYGLRTAAFVSSQSENAFGPWPVSDGLPTLEMHRKLPLDIQVKHMITLGLIDDIIISNCFPSAHELDKLSKVSLEYIVLEVELIDELPTIETKIILEELHFNRGDINPNMIRSTQSRVKYKQHHFEVIHTPSLIKRGDILMETYKNGHYAGEVQIALKDMKNQGKTNVVGRIREDEIFLLDYIKPWQKFSFQKGK